MCLCFLNENMVKPVQNDAVLVLVLSKVPTSIPFRY